MMQVDVEVFGTLRGRLPGDNGRGKGTFELPEDTTIGQAFAQLNIPAEIRYIIMLNEKPEHDRDCVLQSGDKLVVMPPVSGG